MPAVLIGASSSVPSGVAAAPLLMFLVSARALDCLLRNAASMIWVIPAGYRFCPLIH